MFFRPCFMLVVLSALPCSSFIPSSRAVLGVCPTGQGALEGKCWASAFCPPRASPSRPIPQAFVLRPLGGPVVPALTGLEVLELGPQWCTALHSPWGPARPALLQKAPGWHNWQSSTWVALGASQKVLWEREGHCRNQGAGGWKGASRPRQLAALSVWGRG